jgi:tyrosine-protein phosphatase YwqE
MSWLWGKKQQEIFDYGILNADMHSHLLPGVDDGARDMESSIRLIKDLKDLGYKKLITTPHIMWDMYKNTREDLLSRFDVLKEQVEKEVPGMEMAIAAEYFLDDNVKKLLERKAPFLTIGENLVLVEFSMASEPLDLKEILFEMQMQGYQPVIAHPERYVYHEKNKSFFEELKIAGYYFQLNIISLAGAYGKSSAELARYFIKNNYYELAGTDLHSELHLAHLKNPSLVTGLKPLLDSGKLINSTL